MKNALDLKPNVTIGGKYDGYLILDAWKEFQSRQGPYGSIDKQEKSVGQIKVTVEGIQVDYVKISSPAQVAGIQYLVEHSEIVKVSLLRGLLSMFPIWNEIYEEYLPDVSDIGKFKDVIGLSYLHVLSAEKDGFAYIGFELGCTWDEEHGAGVLMHKDRVVEVGQADTSFNSWAAFDDNGTAETEQVKWEEANARIALERQSKGSKIKPWWKNSDCSSRSFILSVRC